MDETNEETCDDASYSAMKEDSEYLLSFVDKYVTVQLLKDITLLGFVQSIDPITCSVILQTPKEDSLRSVIIPGYAVQDITQTPIPEGMMPPPQKPPKPTSVEDSEEIHLKKKKLISWFEKNLIPVTEDGEDIVVGSASLLPPYGLMDIYAETVVVAQQIRKIIGNMPAGFQ